MSTTDAPRVSVVIPGYNAGPFIDDAVRSVLQQTFADLECIVVDDGSTDDTLARLRSVRDDRVTVVTKVNRDTVADARNAALEHVRGDLIAFLDADDVWLPTKLARQVAFLDARPDVGMVHCAYAITDAHLGVRTIIRPTTPDPHFERWLLLEGNGISPSTVVARRSAVEQVGRFRLELSVSEDLDFAERLARTVEIGRIDDCLTLYRTHVGQGHRKMDRFEHDMEWIFRDRFGQHGELDHHRWRRGRGNLHTRLFYYALVSRRYAAAAHHLRVAVGLAPSRLVLLPLVGIRARARRRAARRGLASTLAAIDQFTSAFQSQ